MARDTSKDGFSNKALTYALSHFKPMWDLVQSYEPLKRKVNKFFLNSIIYKIPTRPFPIA